MGNVCVNKSGQVIEKPSNFYGIFK